MRSPEPRFARTAALIAEPSRARMLTLLLGGEARSAGELARAVSITPQTASTHLTQLLDAGLVRLRAQGRHRYFTLADADVAHMLEALSMVAERDDVRSRWDTPAYKPLKYARSCYCHLAGELGVRQHDALLAKGVLAHGEDGAFTLGTDAGKWLRDAHFSDEAIAAVQRDATKKRFAYSCMDWSERREHLAGFFATTLLAHFIDSGWLRKDKAARALAVTPPGARALATLFGVSVASKNET
ncbi:MAG: winged helix-turn-helix domain-containing protein [Casimicrobium sp.]